MAAASSTLRRSPAHDAGSSRSTSAAHRAPSSPTSTTRSTTYSARAKLTWEKQERKAFIPVSWIGRRDGVETFLITMHVTCLGRLRSTTFRLRRVGRHAAGARSFTKLKLAKTFAEGEP